MSMEFHQKETFAANIEKHQKTEHEALMLEFTTKTKIKIWLEETAFDFLGRPIPDLSLHTDAGYRGRLAWIKFYNVKKMVVKN